jgi:hypothetical protein
VSYSTKRNKNIVQSIDFKTANIEFPMVMLLPYSFCIGGTAGHACLFAVGAVRLSLSVAVLFPFRNFKAVPLK